MTTPIDRESVEHEVMWLQTIREHEAADTLLALRAALDAAEAERDALAEKLKDIEAVMVRRIKSARLAKDTANSGNSKQREHHRMHALSEALGEIRKITGGKAHDHTD